MNEFDQYKELLATDSKKLVYDEVDNKETKVTDRWTGIVVENDDPQKLGRVQIRVIGFYDSLPDYLLPWSVPDINYIGSTKGSFIIPEKGTTVRGYFDKGDVQKPIYDSVAFNIDNADRDIFQLDVVGTEYPHKMVLMETDQGDFLTLNRKTGELVFNHRTGAVTMIAANGDISIRTGTNLTHTGNLSVEVLGNASISTNGSTTIKSNGNVDIKTVKGEIRLGNNLEKQLVNNLPVCLICGAKHSVGNTQVKV